MDVLCWHARHTGWPSATPHFGSSGSRMGALPHLGSAGAWFRWVRWEGEIPLHLFLSICLHLLPLYLLPLQVLRKQRGVEVPGQDAEDEERAKQWKVTRHQLVRHGAMSLEHLDEETRADIQETRLKVLPGYSTPLSSPHSLLLCPLNSPP